MRSSSSVILSRRSAERERMVVKKFQQHRPCGNASAAPPRGPCRTSAPAGHARTPSKPAAGREQRHNLRPAVSGGVGSRRCAIGGTTSAQLVRMQHVGCDQRIGEIDLAPGSSGPDELDQAHRALVWSVPLAVDGNAGERFCWTSMCPPRRSRLGLYWARRRSVLRHTGKTPPPGQRIVLAQGNVERRGEPHHHVALGEVRDRSRKPGDDVAKRRRGRRDRAASVRGAGATPSTLPRLPFSP